MSRTFECEAFVLRAVDYRDSDRIITLYTRDRGRLSAIARGARASRRRFAGSLEPFCKTTVELSGTKELKTLRAARVQQAHPAILASLSRIDAAGKATGVVRDLTVDAEPEPRLFDALSTFFASLGNAPVDEQTLRLAFEARALQLAGLGPSVDVCMVSGKRRAEGQAAYFDAQRGGIVRREHLGGAVRAALPMSGAALDHLRTSLRESWVPSAPWPDVVRRQVEAALTAFRQAHVRAPKTR